MSINSRLLSVSFLTLTFGLIAQAANGNSDRGDRIINLAMIRHQNTAADNNTSAENRKASRTEGTLACRQSNQTPCELTLSEGGTGRTYALTRAAAAMKLYALGARKVVIEGIRKEDQIEVQKAESL